MSTVLCCCYYTVARSSPRSDCQTSRSVVQGHWGRYGDPQSGISGYRWGLGTAPGLDNVFAFTELGLRTAAQATGLKLEDGMVVYSTLITCNHAGLCLTTSSDGVLVDGSPPVPVRHAAVLQHPAVLHCSYSCLIVFPVCVRLNRVGKLPMIVQISDGCTNQ